MTQQVFISYSNENESDRRVADRIYDTLKARGIHCWAAHRDIDAGQKWPTEISTAISNSRAMLVVLSEYTQKSSYVEMEVTQAAEEKLIIIPFCIEKVSLSGGLKLLLSNCQWINANPGLQDKDIERLVETLYRRLGMEPEKVLKKEEKLLEEEKELPMKKYEGKAKKFNYLGRVLIAASSIIVVIVGIYFISQLNYDSQTTPLENKTGIVKPGDTLSDVNKTKPAEDAPKNTAAKPEDQSEFISDLKSKGWEIKKNESDCWEAFYKAYDITMIYIPSGKFMMGSNDGDNDERPPHEVCLDGYWIGKYEVTFAQYDRYCEATGKKKPGDNGWGKEKRPVINVSWDDAVSYCNWVSQKTGLTFQLPTEAHWEKAARGTSSLIYPWGNDFDKNKCNSYESGLNKTMPVGSYPAGKSLYGCMDMAGNVYEWCTDWYDEDYYKNCPSKNPQGPALGSTRVQRGGGWLDEAKYSRGGFRAGGHPADRSGSVGFRLSRSL